MTHSVVQALRDFSQRFLQQSQQQNGQLPISHDLFGLASPCVVETLADAVRWQPVSRAVWADFTAMEQAIELSLHEDSKAFYASQFSADMPALWRGRALTLLQVWSEEDFTRLQENLCNVTGNVILEKLGTTQREVLSVDVAEFLQQLEPVVN